LPGSENSDTLLIDAAMATGAAPIYNPPYWLPQYGYCADGALFAGSPALIGISEALKTGATLDSIRMLSVGTGVNPENVPIIGDPRDAGLLTWMRPVSGRPHTPKFALVEALLDAGPQAAVHYCRALLKENFRRANVHLSRQVEIDDYKMVPLMQEDARKYFASGEWQEIKDWVATEFEAITSTRPRRQT
jgi:hypothetical protein